MAGEHAHIPIDDHFVLRDQDSTYGESDVASETTTLKSAISNYYYQHGRRYHAYHAGSYWGPNDAQSADQMDIGHHVFTLALDGRLFLAPVGDHPQKILDLGTGTGIWAIDVADQFPSAQVIGTDLSPIQPREVPPNLQFEVDDFCNEWTYAKDSFDFIHGRGLYGCIGDYTAFYQQVYEHLAPGGWYEQFETGVVCRCDDGSFSDDSIFAQWGHVSLAAGDAFGKSLRTVDEAKSGMIACGLENVVERRYKLPVGGWSSDPKLKELGLYYRLCFEEGIEPWSMYLLTNYLHWRKEEVEVYLAKMRQMLRDKTVHAYVDAVCVYGQKPMRHDNSHADTSSYQSYETSKMSSGLTGKKEKKTDVSMGSGSPKDTDVSAVGKEKPSTDEQKLPKQAYVEPSKGDYGKSNPMAKPTVGSPAGDSTYASPTAHFASPANGHSAAEPQRSGSTPARGKAEERTALQASKVDSAVGLLGSTQSDRMVDVQEQPPEYTAYSTANSTAANDQASNHVQGSSEGGKSSLFGGPNAYNPSQSVVGTDGSSGAKGDTFMSSNENDVSANATNSNLHSTGITTALDQPSTKATEAGNKEEGRSLQADSAPVHGQVSNPIPALAQDPVPLPNQTQPLNFAGKPENDFVTSQISQANDNAIGGHDTAGKTSNNVVGSGTVIGK